jgi:hypothetical protein
MSESELEQPVADLVEQRREVSGEQEEPFAEAPSLPFDVNEADAMEQHREVQLDEDDYR